MRDAIVRGRFKPGERIKEIPLAAELEISRGPIRDALRRLERDGIVEVIPNRGAVVPEIRAVDVLEVYALRAALGSLALHKLMLEEEAVPVPALERTLERLRRAVERGQADRAADADLAYQIAGRRAAPACTASRREFDRLTWQVRIFIVALDLTLVDKLPRILAEMEALHAASRQRRRRRGAVAREVRALGADAGRAAAGAVRRAAVGRAHRRPSSGRDSMNSQAETRSSSPAM